jgi:hypothetical protein
VGTLNKLDRIVLVPRNGLGNRLQAWASSAILAEKLEVPLTVMWEPESPAPALAADLFDAETVGRSFMTRSELDDLLGLNHEDLPRYLHIEPERDFISLAGHDKGEQIFIPELSKILNGNNHPKTLVIIAGGLFHMGNPTEFGDERKSFYQSIDWHPRITELLELELRNQGPYCALHIRQTDRSLEAPTNSSIRAGLRHMADISPLRSLFVAADSLQGRSIWFEEARKIGFEPWTAQGTEFDRTQAHGATSAVLDWLLLCRAQLLTYPAASTFSAEAAVASTLSFPGIPLSATPNRQRVRKAAALARSTVSYPSRLLNHE